MNRIRKKSKDSGETTRMHGLVGAHKRFVDFALIILFTRPCVKCNTTDK